MKLMTFAVLAFVAASTLANPLPYRNTDVHARNQYERGSDEGAFSPFKKRGNVNTGGYATYFYQQGGFGACGKVHSDNDMIAAIHSSRYGSSICGKQVKITNPSNGKSVVVAIADSCPGCRNQNSIDLSVGAFKQIADLSQGVVGINWVFM